MDRELPEVLHELEAVGGLRMNLLAMLPAAQRGPWRDGDDRFETVTARRPVLEAALAAVAARTPGVTIRRGVTVTGLLTDARSWAGAPGHRRARRRRPSRCGPTSWSTAAAAARRSPSWLEAAGRAPAGRGAGRLRLRLLRRGISGPAPGRCRRATRTSCNATSRCRS